MRDGDHPMSSTSTAATASCRILTISSSVSHAQRFVQRLISFATHTGETPPDATAQQNTIPWTISNKYYTADVHFEIIPISERSAKHVEGVPAILFVWEQGESYKDKIELLSRELASHDSDVTLAIKLNSQTQSRPDEEADDGMDEFLSLHGFEYIDGNNDSGRRAIDDEGDTGTPGLARVVDALSTIMWPSMTRSASNVNRKSRARELLDWARAEEAEDGLRALIQAESVQEDEGPLPVDKRKSRMQKEMEEFERWLEEDERQQAQQDPWAQRGDDLERDPISNAKDSMQVLPTTVLSFEEQRYSGGAHGFEDDFDEFVGAPLTIEESSSSAFLGPPKKLESMHTGASYMSLASDFGGDISKSHDRLEGTHNDEDLPSHAEIEATSRKLFGVSNLPPAFPSDPSTNEHTFDHLDEDDEFELSAFDLSRVFSALQAMKEEISEIGDDGERRKAAARVALGLVHGLQADKNVESDEDND